jgi:hypothetical protein
LISFALAVLNLRLIENPLRFAAPLRDSALRSLALGGVATALAVCVGVALLVVLPTPVGRGAPAATLTITAAPAPAGSTISTYDAAVRHAFTQVQAAVAASANVKAVPSNLNPSLADVAAEDQMRYFNGCVRNLLEVGQPECASGDTASTTTLALVGDSNAAMWNPAFQQIAMQRRWRLETLAKAGCPLLDVPITNPTLGREYTECEHWRGQILARLQAEHPRLVVLSVMRRYGLRYGSPTGLTSYEPAWVESLTRLVQQLRGTGAKVLVLGPIPDPQSFVPDCLSGHLDDATDCTPPRSTALNESGIAAETAATEAGGGRYVDLTELFCTAQRCPVIVGNTLVFRDDNHITAEYAQLLSPVMAHLAESALAPN